MTYQEAQEMITIHGEYYNDLARPFKRKILPKKAEDELSDFPFSV